MFGFVTANMGELTKDQANRYGAVYCGICRSIAERWGQLPRMTLQYDMVFLAMLLMSLYEPEEISGNGRCMTHPFRSRPWVQSEIIRYCADMNVALAYWKCVDDWRDDGIRSAKWMSDRLKKACVRIETQYPRQWNAMKDCMEELSKLEQMGCPEIDRNAACFGSLMAALLDRFQDHWSSTLRPLGYRLGQFIYYMDAAVDMEKDAGKGRYNPWCTGEHPYSRAFIEQILVQVMEGCTRYYEALPLVQDKDILDNILYSGVWVNYRNKWKEAQPHGSV